MVGKTTTQDSLNSDIISKLWIYFNGFKILCKANYPPTNHKMNLRGHKMINTLKKEEKKTITKHF